MNAQEGATDGSTFSGTIIRSLRRSGSMYREFFQLFDADEIEDIQHPILGNLILDEFAFAGAPKLGPAIIYERAFEEARDSEFVRYFARNKAVVLDAKHRAEVERIPDFVWPSDEEYVAGFHQIYSPELLRQAFPTADPIWDAAAMRSFQWLTARAIVRKGDETLEVLCWSPESPRVPEAEIYRKILKHFFEEGLEVVGNLIELFQSHSLRPQSGTYVFEIARTSSLDVKAYVDRFVQIDPE
jgi:hypothetical protein